MMEEIWIFPCGTVAMLAAFELPFPMFTQLSGRG